MSKRIRTAISLLICAMMLLTQFAFAIEEAEVPAGAETAKETAAESEKAAPEEVKEEPAKEEAKPAAEAPKEEAKAEEEKKEDSAKEESKAEKKEPAKEETKAEQKKEEKKDSKPSFSDEAKINGVKVSVKAAEGIFPEGAKLSVEKVSKDNQKKVDKAVDEAREDNLNVAAVYSFDVKVLDKNGKEIQPADKKKVDISFKLDEADDANLDATIYHLEDTKSGLKAEELKTKTDKDVVSAETNGFSYYTVEFTYNDLQYVMDGDSSVALSDILKTVGLEGEVTDVKVSNADLFSAEKKDDKWIVTAHKAFTSTEWMKVTIDGVEYEIVVTDAIPDNNVTSEVEMKAGESKEGDFTIGNSGVVLGPYSGTATIKNCIVTNNAKNNKNGKYSTSNGSAFIARGNNSLQFKDVTIKSGVNILVLNIWANCSITAENTTLSGSNNSNNSNNGVPFLMIGGYPNGSSGTLNFEGTSDIVGAKGSIIGGNGSSVINVNDGTLTINNSEIVLENGIKLIANSGASLIVKGTTELTGTKPTIKSGATLDITSSGKYTLDNVGSSFDFEEGAILKVNSYKISEVIVNSGEKVTISGTGDITKEGGWNIIRKIGNKSVTIKANEVTVAENAPVTVKSGGELTFDNVTLADRNNITIESGGKAWLKGTNIFTDCEIVNSGSICVAGTSAEIKDSSLTFSGNSGLIKVEAGKALTIDPTTIKPTGKQQVQVWGTFNLEETVVDLSQNGAIRWIRIEGGGTANISKSTLSGSTSLGVIRANAGSTLNIENSTLEKNKANGSAEQVNGGVILAWDSDITVKESTFTGNSAANGGGAIWASNCKLDVSDSTFNNNNSHSHGGAIYQSGGTATVSRSTFGGNVATNDSGGAIWQDNTKLTVEKSTFSNNTAKQHGGAIYHSKGAATIGDEASFNDNTAYLGGAIYLQDCEGSNIGKATFKENGTKFPDDTWENAIMTCDGGAIYMSGGSAEFNGTTFRENVAAYSDSSPKTAGSGGGIYMHHAKADFNGVKFESNTALLHGGGLTVAHDSKASIKDLNGDPTEFTENLVEYGMDQAGGGLFINFAYVNMADTAIYDNAADDAGGGISTCTRGAAQARVMNGAAIFDNKILAGDHKHGGGFFPPVKDVKKYQDIYFQTIDHKNKDTGELLPGLDFPPFPYELYERMFNEGLHNWKAKPITTQNEQGVNLNSFVAQSNPTNKKVSKAKVVFTGNQAWRNPKWGGTVSGGAIASNGLLEIGTATEIKIVKLWDDKPNPSARPDKDYFLKHVKILADGEEIDKDEYLIDVITENVEDYVLRNNIVDVGKDPVDFGDKVPWLIIVSGLPKYSDDAGTKPIEYSIDEKPVNNYQLIDRGGDMSTYFRIDNKLELIKIDVEKKWDDKDDDAVLRPETVDIKLLADGKDTGKVLTLGKDNNWKGEFKDLLKYDGDKEIEYSVEEVIEGNLEYYTSTISGDAKSGFTIKNSLEVLVEEESSGVKNWVGDEEGDRPESITIQLLENGTPLEDVILEISPDENGEWTYRFDGMPKYRNGEEIEYSVKELNVPEGYIDEADGFNLTNTYTGRKPETSFDFKFKKKWDDKDDEDGIRPEKVTVRLMRNDEFTGDVLTLTEEDNWEGSFEDLPIADSDGTEYTYGFAEDEVSGYNLDKVESEGEYTVLVNKHEVSKKVKGAKTGDDTHAMNLLILLAACTAVLTAISIRRRREK